MKNFFIVLSFLFSLITHAQNEANIWYFGNRAGIDFNSGTAVPINDGEMITLEGCATISDLDGNLLFYTDGSIVYNANHTIMPNGTGLNGDNSSSQSAIIVKKPGTNSIYYIFTVDAFGFSNGFQYSEVDMTLQGGLGDVTAIKNVNIYGPTCEKVTAIAHGNGIDYWIVTHEFGSSNFRSYLLNNTGLATTPVISPSGANPSGVIQQSIGYLRTNIFGTKIAYAQWTNSNFFDPGSVKVYDFDNATGNINNPITLDVLDPYGLEFSPSGQFLYVGQGFASPVSTLYQYDLNAGSEIDIQNSQDSIASAPTSGALQLAPDQKIYIAMNGSNTLATISSPDSPGALCNFNLAGFTLSPGKSSMYGLPTFFNNITAPNPQTASNLCIGDSIELSSPLFSSYNWALQSDPLNIISTDSTLTVSPLTSTNYILYDNSDTMVFEIIIGMPLPLNLGPNICDAVDSVVLNVAQPGASYLWQDGSDSSYFTATSTGTYWVEITDGICTTTDSIFIQFEQIIIEGNSNVYCDSTVVLNVVDSNPIVGYWTYLTPPGGINNVIFTPNNKVTNPTITVPELGEYIFTYTSACGVSDQHSVLFESVPPILNINLTQECNFTISLNVNNPVQDGYWTAEGPEGETIQIADINQPNTSAEVSNYGEYTFTYSYDFCDGQFSNTIEIQSIEPIITNSQTLYICNKTIDLSAIVPGQEQQWSVKGPGIVTFNNHQTLNATAEVSDYGDYTFYYSGCGGTDSIEVSFTQSTPVINAPTYVTCANEALVEVLNYGDQIGTWSYEAGTDENITLSEIDINTLSVTSDSYGEVDLTYTVCDTFTTVNIVFMCDLDIPNVISPNNDGMNNDFMIKRLSPKFYDYSVFTVYNRWGVEVYTNGKYGLEGAWWNGKTSNQGENLPEGVYYYELELHNKVNDLDEIYKGTIHIFR